jgi:hypothetical protein
VTERPMMPPPCEHHWVCTHQPDFPAEVYWIIQCSQCGGFDGADLTRSVHSHDGGSDGAGRGQEGGKEALRDDPRTLGHPGGSAALTDARVDRQVDLAFKVVAANAARDAALAERDQLAARLARVAALHLLDQEEEGFCEGCQEDWPCPTRAILDPAAGGGALHTDPAAPVRKCGRFMGEGWQESCYCLLPETHDGRCACEHATDDGPVR